MVLTEASVVSLASRELGFPSSGEKICWDNMLCSTDQDTGSDVDASVDASSLSINQEAGIRTPSSTASGLEQRGMDFSYTGVAFGDFGPEATTYAMPTASTMYSSYEALQWMPTMPACQFVGMPGDIGFMSPSMEDEGAWSNFLSAGQGNEVTDYPRSEIDTNSKDFQEAVCRALAAAQLHEQSTRSLLQQPSHDFNEVQNDKDDVSADLIQESCASPSSGNDELQNSDDASTSVWKNADYPTEFGQVLLNKSMRKKMPNYNWSSYQSPGPGNINDYNDASVAYPSYLPSVEWSGAVTYDWQNEQGAGAAQDPYCQSGLESYGWYLDEGGNWQYSEAEPEAHMAKWPTHAGSRYTIKQWAQPDVQQETTTFMMHNVPKDRTQHTLIDLLDEIGLVDTYDLIYVPLDRNTQQNMGYAFINFIDGLVAKTGEEILSSSAMVCKTRQRCMKRRCWLSAAHLQGFEANVEHYQTTSSKPLIRVDGEWTELGGA